MVQRTQADGAMTTIVIFNFLIMFFFIPIFETWIIKVYS